MEARWNHAVRIADSLEYVVFCDECDESIHWDLMLRSPPTSKGWMWVVYSRPICVNCSKKEG